MKKADVVLEGQLSLFGDCPPVEAPRAGGGSGKAQEKMPRATCARAPTCPPSGGAGPVRGLHFVDGTLLPDGRFKFEPGAW